MSTLYCAFCLVVRKDNLERAITICNGQACCFDHLYYVQGGEYNRILAIIKTDELKKENTVWKENAEKLQEELKEDKSILGKTQRRLGRLLD